MPRKTSSLSPGRAPSPPASMRPRPDAAENYGLPENERAGVAASMRPRPDAAENICAGRCGQPFTTRFNEAAARCRGKPSARTTSAEAHALLQ